MRRSASALAMGIFVVAALTALAVGAATATWIERRTLEDVRVSLDSGGHGWADVRVDGLRVYLTGTAPDEVSRFQAISRVGALVEAGRIRDGVEVAAASAIAPPAFALEILRNDDGVSLIGLVPDRPEHRALIARIGDIAQAGEVVDMTETAGYPVPEAWDPAVAFGLEALALLARSKVSVSEGRVVVAAIAGSLEEKARTEARLRRGVPEGVALELRISAPRPVISPFRFLAERGVDGLEITACSAPTEQAARRILAAAGRAGLRASSGCAVGLGEPTARWTDAVVGGIETLARLGNATLAFDDADVTLRAETGVDAALFNRVVRELEGILGDLFALDAEIADMPETATLLSDMGAGGFIALRSPEGVIQLRGAMADERTGNAVEAFAVALVGRDRVYNGIELDPDLPEGWTRRAMAGIEALSHLHSGTFSLGRDGGMRLRGRTGVPEGDRELLALFAERAGDIGALVLDIDYDPALDPARQGPSPEECIARINEQGQLRKITFAPGSTEVTGEARETLRRIADILRECRGLRLEIAGHTDSQGRESMNIALSQSRADAVLDALMGMRVLTSGFVARGYGPSQPIADNATEAGREANRRIEFRLLSDTEEAAEDDQAADEASQPDAGESDESDPAEDPETASDAQEQEEDVGQD